MIDNYLENFEEDLSEEEEELLCGAYRPQDIQQILCVGRTTTYRFLEEVFRYQEPFVVLRVGKQFRVPKMSFDKWFRGQNDERMVRK